MAAKSLVSVGLLLGLMALVVGCAESESPVQSAKRYEEPPKTPAAPSSVYKVGKPYQIKKIWYYPRVDYSYDETGIASWYGPGFHGKRTANGEIYDQNALTAAHRTLPMPSMVQVTNLENGRSIQVRINDRGPFAHGRIIDLSQRGAELLDFRRKGTARVRVQVLDAESRRLINAAEGPQPGEGDAPQAAPVETVSVQQLPPAGEAAPATPASKSVQPAASRTALLSGNQTASLTAPNQRVTKRAVRRTLVYVQAGAFTEIANAKRLRARLSGLGSVQIVRAVVGDTRFFRVRLGPMQTLEQADKTLELLLYNGVTNAKVVVE